MVQLLFNKAEGGDYDYLANTLLLILRGDGHEVICGSHQLLYQSKKYFGEFN